MSYPDHIRAEVLDWMDSTKRGYKAASKHFQIPPSTIRSWRVTRRGVQARTSAPARDSGEVDPPPEHPQTAVEFWSERLKVARTAVSVAIGQGHAGTAATWEGKVGDAFTELERAKEADAVRVARAAASDERDPVVLARRLVAQLPSLLAVADDPDLVASAAEAIEVWRGSL